MPKPTVVIAEVPSGSPQRAAAEALETACRRAVNKLDAAGAFNAAPKAQIRIVADHGAMTHHDRVRQGHALHPPPVALKGAPRVDLGARLMTVGEGGRLVAAGATDEEALAFILAHEVRHLTDMLRVRDCGGTFPQSASFFSAAMDPRLPAAVNHLLREAATAYVGYSREPLAKHLVLPVEVAKAHDVAVELRADLEAKIWTLAAGLWSLGLEAAVMTTRSADEAADPPSKYQIGTEWLQVTGIADLDSATVATVSRCVSILAASPAVSGELRELAREIALPVALSPPPTSLVRKLFGARPAR